MSNFRPMSPENKRKLADTKKHWTRDGKPVDMAGLPRREAGVLYVPPHPRKAEMDAYRAIPRYIPKPLVIA